MLTTMETRQERLGRYVKSRRRALNDMTLKEAAAAAGIAIQTWSNVEAGKSASERTLSRIDKALWWEPGSAEDVLNGGEPRERPMPTDARPLGDPEVLRRLEAIERQLAQLLEQQHTAAGPAEPEGRNG